MMPSIQVHRWSNFGMQLGGLWSRLTRALAATPAFLTLDWLLAQFGSHRPAAQRKYRAFVAEGLGRNSPWEYVQGQVLLGSERFVEHLLPGLRDKRSFKEIPREKRKGSRNH
jgi:putative transposase